MMWPQQILTLKYFFSRFYLFMSRHKFPEIVVKIRITEPLMGHPNVECFELIDKDIVSSIQNKKEKSWIITMKKMM